MAWSARAVSSPGRTSNDRRRAALIAWVALSALLASACSAGPGGRSGSPVTPTPAAADPAASPSPKAAPARGDIPEVLEFSAPRLGGGRVRGSELAGAPVAMWFWAPW